MTDYLTTPVATRPNRINSVKRLNQSAAEKRADPAGRVEQERT